MRTFGSVVSAEFIGALVQGLPDLPTGAPGLALFSEVLHRGADAIPRSYGDATGARVYSLMKQRFRDYDLVEEAMLTFVVTAVRGRVHLTPGCALTSAERYVLTAVANSAKNILRTRWRRQRGEVPFEPEPLLDEPQKEYPDPRSVEEEDRVAVAIDLRAALGVAKGHQGGLATPTARSSRTPPKQASDLTTSCW